MKSDTKSVARDISTEETATFFRTPFSKNQPMQLKQQHQMRAAAADLTSSPDKYQATPYHQPSFIDL
ncbi:hypothetical protein EIP74_02360 [Xylella fastidiosa subsp. pauca]|uniref:hypothetical protein n=1 Tax=Xylella fastidiosa TaxID=2371 RepID=UPI001121D764|nr:hypothetical protein [Xylella fastidiosa]TNW25357.1 hypothetical protein EIP74_02360 [Xylella fastidiosa subsp. pauca]